MVLDHVLAGVHRAQVGAFDDAHAPALHLLEEAAAFDAAQEDDDLDRLDVGAGGDHVHGDGDARVVAAAEGADQVFRGVAGAAVGDLLRELVAAAEFLADDLDDGFGVVVVLGEDQGLGQFRAAREHLGLPAVAEGLHHGADLVGRLHAAVQLGGVVVEILVELPVAAAARVALHHLHPVAGLDLAAGFGDFGADAIDVVIDIDAVGHGLLVAVFHDQVLVEEAEGLLVGRGGEADQVGVEVVEHLAPQLVDGAVGFVGDDDVEALDRDRRVVIDGRRIGEQRFDALGGMLVFLLGQFAALEHRVHALDGADDDARALVEVVAGQVLDDVFLAELEVVVGRKVLVEFLLGLAPEVATIDQEQHATGAGELDQAVDEADGGEGLAAAGSHLDQRARLVGGEAGFEVFHCLDLGGPKLPTLAAFDQHRHFAHARQKSRRWRCGDIGVLWRFPGCSAATRPASPACGRQRRAARAVRGRGRWWSGFRCPSIRRGKAAAGAMRVVRRAARRRSARTDFQPPSAWRPASSLR